MSTSHLQETRPQKRPRIDENSPSRASSISSTFDTARSLKRHPELWFDDGSVILVSQNTGFRVFRSLLAEQSTVFADMVSSSSPNACEMLKGCPLVHLPDTPEDLSQFLEILFKPKYQRLLFSRVAPFSFHQISAIIRLAHKYHVQDILDRAIMALQENWFPTADLDTWEAHAKEAMMYDLQYAISAVNLARLVDEPSLLPTAFYHCTLLGTEVLDGCRCRDKSVEHLSLEDLKHCIDGRSTLMETAVEVVSKVFITRPCEGCATQSHCRGALQAMLESAVASKGASDSDVLQTWKHTIDDWTQEHGLCNLCKDAAIERDHAARKAVWESLPTIFDVEVEGWVAKKSGEE